MFCVHSSSIGHCDNTHVSIFYWVAADTNIWTQHPVLAPKYQSRNNMDQISCNLLCRRYPHHLTPLSTGDITLHESWYKIALWYVYTLVETMFEIIALFPTVRGSYAILRKFKVFLYSSVYISYHKFISLRYEFTLFYLFIFLVSLFLHTLLIYYIKFVIIHL